jgi:SecD/SecF fusion protein
MFAQAAELPQLKFYQTGWFVFLLLIAAIALGWFLANQITKGLKLSEYSGRMAIVLIALFVASLMIWSKWPPKFGVDLRGGINIVGSLNLDAFGEEDSSLMGNERPNAAKIIPALVRRVNPSGTKEIMIRPLGEDKIEVTIPTVEPQEADDIWDRLVKAGKLEFRILASPQYAPTEIEAARKMAEAGERGRKVTTVVDDEKVQVAAWVDLAREAIVPGENKKILPFKFIPDRGNLVRDKSSGQIIDLSTVSYSSLAENHGRDLAVWCSERGIRVPQILVLFPEEDSNVEGKHLTGVSSTIDEQGRGAVAFKTSNEGSTKMGMLTKLNIDRPMGIVLDNQLHSAPNIQSAIYNNGQITGNFTPEEVDELIINLESGKLDVALNKSPISRDFIESNLGQELKEKGIWAISCSLLLVLVFMVFYYRFAGIVATVALLLNLVLILALVMAINQPLTLTGLAGLVLTVGMSVDANVLIFERIREELDRGAALRMAIRNGFDKATTTIVDANVTTLITAIVLYVIGTEQIKGFSVTLILGILMSMFTAIFVSRLIFDIFERKRWLTKLNMTRILDRNKWNFLNKISVTGVVSAALIIGGLCGMFMLGKKILNHDLRGGSTVRMVFNDAQKVEDIRSTLAAKDFEHDGEKVEFTVSGFNNQADPDMAGKVFKVDSNLPAWEGESSGVEKFKQLNELLAETFEGKLKLHNVQIEGLPNNGAGSGAGSGTDTGFTRPRNHATPVWSALPAVSMASAMVSYQEEATESEATESQASETESTETETEAPTTTTATQDETSEPENSASDTSAPADGNQDEAPAVLPGVDGQDPVDAAPAEFQASEIKVERKLTVNPPLQGKSLRAAIVAASIAERLDLEEEQVSVDTADVAEDESPLSTISDKWTVTMDVSKESEADTILSSWSERFNSQPYFPTSSKVGGQIAGQTQLQALAAIVASLLGIIAYVWIRFQNVAFGLAAVIALVHDVLIVLGAIAISHWLSGIFGFLGVDKFKISLEVVAALLTVIGYSLNDTIVVFDRIREVRGKRSEITADMINTSISQTLSRTILTSITTFIVVFILYWFGGDAIHGFAFALVVGVVVGTYSSIFVASPALLWLMNTVGLNPGEVDLDAE